MTGPRLSKSTGLPSRSAGEKYLRAIAKILAKKIPGADPNQLAWQMRELDPDVIGPNLERSREIESGTEAKDRLMAVSSGAEELLRAIKALGPGALEIINRKSANEALWNDAEPWDLPKWDDSEDWSDPSGIIDFNDPQYEEKTARILDEWRRGGAWVVRLQALAELTEERASLVEQRITKGGKKTLDDRLHGSRQKRLLNRCLRFLMSRGADPKLALPMAKAIWYWSTGVEPGAQWGVKAFKGLFQTPSK